MDLLITAYLVNATLLITHEIDSAYWHEWKLFKIPGGVTTFLTLHLPLIGLILFGLIQLTLGNPSGLIISWILAAGGLFAFTIHTIFINQGHPEFKTAVSQVILWSILLMSIAQVSLLVNTSALPRA